MPNDGPQPEYPVSPWQTVALIAAAVIAVVAGGAVLVGLFQWLL